MVSTSLASVLAARRPVLNQSVTEARHRLPSLDTAAFSAFVATEVDAVCVAVEGVDALAATAAVEAAFGIGLDLVAQGLAGPAARIPWVNRAWQRLARPAAAVIARSPVEALGAITNAVVRMGSVPGVRVDEWIDEMATLAPRCATLDSLRSLGAICAWRAGMAHLRQGALAQAAQLDPELAAAAVGSPSTPWGQLHERLRGERWWNPATGELNARGHTVGAFSGFGGPFAFPPEVRAGADGFVVESAERHFLVMVDAFGAVILPASPAEFAQATSTIAPNVSISPRGARIHDKPIEFPGPGDRIKAVASTDSVALFSPWSHQIRIVPARP